MKRIRSAMHKKYCSGASSHGQWLRLASPITLQIVQDATGKVIPRLDRNFFRVRLDRLTLGGPCSYTGATSLSAGALQVDGSLGATAITVANGAKLSVNGSVGGTVTVQSGGALAGAGGTFSSAVAVQSGAITFYGGTLAMAGFNGSNATEFAPMPNALIVPTGQTGTLHLTQRAPKPGAANIFPAIYGTLSGGGALNATGHFVNNGVIDLLTGAQAVPADFENNGVVIDSSSLGKVQVSKVGNVVTLIAPGYTQHTYQLQRADSLVSPNSGPIGGAQVPLSNGQPLTFTDSAATGVQRFYRITVSP